MREEGAIHFQPQFTCWLNFQINFCLLRLIASDGYKSEREKVAKQVTTPFQILNSRWFLSSAFSRHFPGSQEEVAMGPWCHLVFLQTERGFPISLLLPQIPFSASDSTLRWTAGIPERMNFKPTISWCMQNAEPSGFLYCTKQPQEAKGKCLSLSEVLWEYCSTRVVTTFPAYTLLEHHIS